MYISAFAARTFGSGLWILIYIPHLLLLSVLLVILEILPCLFLKKGLKPNRKYIHFKGLPNSLHFLLIIVLKVFMKIIVVKNSAPFTLFSIKFTEQVVMTFRRVTLSCYVRADRWPASIILVATASWEVHRPSSYWVWRFWYFFILRHSPCWVTNVLL